MNRKRLTISAIVLVVVAFAASPFLAVFVLSPRQFGGSAAPWWSPRAAGLIGGIGGSIVGILGGIIGGLGGAGKARKFVIGTLYFECGLGIVSLVLGIAALIARQGYAVYYPLLLLGFLMIVIPISVLPGVRKRYEEIEMRKMKAQDM